MAGIEIRITFIWLCIAGVVASRAQCRFGIFTVGRQMGVNQVKLS